jgi:hypothetical protein
MRSEPREDEPPTISDDDMDRILEAYAGDEAKTITNVPAFVEGWVSRELETLDTSTKDDIRHSLEALRRLMGAVSLRTTR